MTAGRRPGARHGRPPVSGSPRACATAGQHQRRIVQRLEGDEGDAIGKVRRDFGRHRQGKAGLAHPAGAGQRDQRHVLPPQQGTDRRDLLIAADQRGAWRRQGSGEVGERDELEGDVVGCRHGLHSTPHLTGRAVPVGLRGPRIDGAPMNRTQLRTGAN